MREQLLFSAPLQTVPIFEVPREEEMGEDTSQFAFISDKLPALPVTAVPVPGGAEWGREQLEAGVPLLLAAHTPGPQPGGSCTAPGEAEPG